MCSWISRVRCKFSKGPSSLYRLHLSRVFPQLGNAELDELIACYWKTHERNLLGLFYLAGKKPNEVLGRVSWKGRDILERSIKRGRGVLLLVPHYGDERGLHVIMGMAGYKVHVITSRYTDMPPFCRQSRLAPGEKWNVMHFPDESPRWMYSTLEQGGIVHYGSTAYGGPGGTWITSFGVPVLVPSAPWKLWRRTGCVVLGAYCTQTADMGWELSFRMLDTPDDRREFAYVAGTAAEEAARLSPGQYEWKNLAIRHRETNTIIRTGVIPVNESELEKAAIPEDSDPMIIHPEEVCLLP